MLANTAKQERGPTRMFLRSKQQLSDINKIYLALASCIITCMFWAQSASAAPAAPTTVYGVGLSSDRMAVEWLRANPDLLPLGKTKWGGADDGGPATPTLVDPSTIPGASALGTKYPPTPASAMKWMAPTKIEAAIYKSQLQLAGGFTPDVPSDLLQFQMQTQSANLAAKMTQYPPYVANRAQAAQSAQMTAAGNALGDVSKDQAASAIDYCSKYMQNFTVTADNKWNKLRDMVFVPIAILLLLPGAIATQVVATISQGSPVLGSSDDSGTSPFNGILRSLVAIFLIPGTYLIVNYGIDLSNTINYTLSSQYAQLFKSDMYKDAVCSEIRACPVRSTSENNNAGQGADSWPATTVKTQKDLEQAMFDSKLDDPCTGLNVVSPDRTDEAMPAAAVYGRAFTFGTNAALTAGWNVLCAFQMAYLLYLYLVGPIMAALWVWPMKQLQQGLPSWIEGCITICFWSLFWNTVILLMACFKGSTGETGTIITTALNFLATSAVKYAFDFVSLVRAAGQEAGQKAASGGGKGAGGQHGAPGSHKAGHPGAHGRSPANPHGHTAPGIKHNTAALLHSTGVSTGHGHAPGGVVGPHSGPHTPGTMSGHPNHAVTVSPSKHPGLTGVGAVHVGPPPTAKTGSPSTQHSWQAHYNMSAGGH
jgi:hypothetical protein